MNPSIHEHLAQQEPHSLPTYLGLGNAAAFGFSMPLGCSSSTLEQILKDMEGKIWSKMDYRFKGHEKLRLWSDIETVSDQFSTSPFSLSLIRGFLQLNPLKLFLTI